VLVVVVAVRGVAVLTVHVVDVIVVLHCGVATVVSVGVVVFLGLSMLGDGVFIDVAVVDMVGVAVVQVVGVPVVVHCSVAALLPVSMGVIGVGVVGLGAHWGVLHILVGFVWGFALVGALLDAVRQGIPHHVANVLIGQRVVNFLAATRAADEVKAAQYT